MATYCFYWRLRNATLAINVHADSLRDAVMDPVFRMMEGEGISVAIAERDMRAWMRDTIDRICNRRLHWFDLLRDSRGIVIGLNTDRPLQFVKLGEPFTIVPEPLGVITP